MCGVYGMPLLIPLVAYVESWKLAATILISTSVRRRRRIARGGSRLGVRSVLAEGMSS